MAWIYAYLSGALVVACGLTVERKDWSLPKAALAWLALIAAWPLTLVLLIIFKQGRNRP